MELEGDKGMSTFYEFFEAPGNKKHVNVISRQIRIRLICLFRLNILWPKADNVFFPGISTKIENG